MNLFHLYLLATLAALNVNGAGSVRALDASSKATVDASPDLVIAVASWRPLDTPGWRPLHKDFSQNSLDTPRVDRAKDKFLSAIQSDLAMKSNEHMVAMQGAVVLPLIVICVAAVAVLGLMYCLIMTATEEPAKSALASPSPDLTMSSTSVPAAQAMLSAMRTSPQASQRNSPMMSQSLLAQKTSPLQSSSSVQPQPTGVPMPSMDSMQPTPRAQLPNSSMSVRSPDISQVSPQPQPPGSTMSLDSLQVGSDTAIQPRAAAPSAVPPKRAPRPEEPPAQHYPSQPKASFSSTALIVKSPDGVILQCDHKLTPHPEHKMVHFKSLKGANAVVKAFIDEIKCASY